MPLKPADLIARADTIGIADINTCQDAKRLLSDLLEAERSVNRAVGLVHWKIEQWEGEQEKRARASYDAAMKPRRLLTPADHRRRMWRRY